MPSPFKGDIGVYIGIMEKKMETTTMGYIGSIGYILGLYRGGLYKDNGKENGNYYLGFRVWGLCLLYCRICCSRFRV